MLDVTQESVQSALKRARAKVDAHLADAGSSRLARVPNTTTESAIVAQLTDALERADLPALVGLLVTIADDRITAVTGFGASVLPGSGCPGRFRDAA